MNFFFPDWRSAATSRARDGAITLRRAFAHLEPFAEVPGVPGADDSSSAATAPDRGVLFRTRIVEETRAALELLTAASAPRVFSILGTCGAELAPVSYLNARYGGDLAVVWLDAHGDLNTPDSSPSKRFHGMVLRTLAGDGDPALTGVVSRPLTPSQIVPAGTRDLDPPEREYLAVLGINPVAPDALQRSPDALVAAIRATRYRHIYVHLDLDVLDPAEFPNVLVPAPGGLSLTSLHRTLQALAANFDYVGVSIVEYADGKTDRTAEVATLVAPLVRAEQSVA